VPLFVSGPGVERKGEREPALINTTDLFATIAALAGVNVAGVNDSWSFTELLASPAEHPRLFLYSEMVSENVESWAVSDGVYKLIETESGVQELYRLTTDPYENDELVSRGLAPQDVLDDLQSLAGEIRLDGLASGIPDDNAGIIDVKDAIFTRTSADCADYANSYKAEVLDQQRSRTFTESVVITATDDSCSLASNGIPNHDFNDSSAHFATPVSEIDSVFEISRNPLLAAKATLLSQRTYDAVMLNGVVLDLLSAGCYRPGSNMADANGNVAIGCSVNDNWLLDPLGYTDRFGADLHSAHTQPDGRYHYHGNPNAMFSDSASPGVSPVIGFTADGFPIYGSYFFDAASKTIRKAVSGYTLRKGTRDSSTGPGGTYNGWYIDDYEFTNAGDLDVCNGMTVDGQYGYYVTDSYPWVLGCISGTPHASFNKN
jgi:hypothetical protein